MKKIISLLSLIILFAYNTLAQEVINQANEAYSNGNYTDAIALYEQALDENGASPQIYYNLGNSHYRLNQIASAILNYERALLLDPANDDIKFNLEIAKLKTVDKIEGAGQLFLIQWYNSIQNSLSTDGWSYIAIACFILLIACLFAFFFSRDIRLKKIGFYFGIVAVIICIFSNTFAYKQEKELMAKNTAIIFTPTTTIKSSPDASGTDLFILHEGTKVRVKDHVGEWSEIETTNGSIGWIRSSEIEII